MRKLSVGKKLGGTFAGLLGALVLLAAMSLWAISSLRSDLNDMNTRVLKKADLANSIQTASRTLRADVRGVLMGAALKHAQEVQKFRTATEADFAELGRLVGEIRPLLSDSRAPAIVDTIMTALPALKDSEAEAANLSASGRVDAADKIRQDRQAPLLDTVDKASDDLLALEEQEANDEIKLADERAALGRDFVVGAVIIGMIIGVFALLIIRDLIRTLRRMVKELSSGGEQVAAASGQIAATSQTLSQGASEQAASIQEISASMEQMTAMTKRNSDNSTEATAMMAETVKQVERSNAALADMVASMSSIKVSSEKVAKINKTIDEIAFQTNILALNAAVEAARAGEAGMGFAVVADEVRNLAQRSAVAAKDTAALIEESIANANQGTERLDLVSAAVRGITEGAGKVKNLLDEVNESSKQQGQGIQQVSTAISQVSTVTQTAAASAEESAAASEQLSAQSQTVRDLVQTLAETVEGAGEHRSDLHRLMGLQAAHSGAKPKVKLSGPKHDDPFPMEPMETGSFREF